VSGERADEERKARELIDFALSRWRRTPRMTVRDAYKWLFQATLGGEHAVSDPSGPSLLLDEEWAGLDEPFPGESVLESLRPDGALARVNLRPFKQAGGEKERLLRVFLDSARAFRVEKEAFLLAWRACGARLPALALPAMTPEDWKSLDARCRADGYPPLHHSPAYEAAYRPAYRVVLSEIWRSSR